MVYPCGINVDVGNGRTIWLSPPDHTQEDSHLRMMSDDDDGFLFNLIFDRTYAKSSNSLLTAIRDFVDACNKVIHGNVPNLDTERTVENRTLHKDLDTTFSSLINGSETLKDEAAKLESVTVNAIEHAYSQNYNLGTPMSVVPNHIVYPHHCFLDNAIPRIIGVINGELHIIGRKVNADQEVIDNFDKVLAVQLLRQFYYHLTS